MYKTPIEILRQLLRQATPGYWRQDGHCVVTENTQEESKDDYADICIADCSDDVLTEEASQANAALVVAAKEHMPALVDIIEKLNNDLESLGFGSDATIDPEQVVTMMKHHYARIQAMAGEQPKKRNGMKA